MMKLFYKTGACSLSPHIILRETGQDFSIERVDLINKKTNTGQDFLAINPKGQVPTLVLDDGSILTEGVAIVQYLADQVPERKLIAPIDTLARYRAIEWLNYIATELHKGFSPLFNPKTPNEYKVLSRKRLDSQFAYIESVLADHTHHYPYLLGKYFNVADSYLFTTMSWAKNLQFNLENYKNLKTYLDLVAARPSVQAALEAEKNN